MDCCLPVQLLLLCPWNSPGKNTGVGSHSLLQGNVLTQGSNPGLLHCRQILYHLRHQGSPTAGRWGIIKLVSVLMKSQENWALSNYNKRVRSLGFCFREGK